MVVHRDTILWMPTEQILSLLLAERDKLSRAIEALQGPTKRIGRPPKNSLAAVAPAVVAPPAKRKRRRFTAAQRKAQGARMKAYWVAKRKAEAKVTKKTVRKPKKTAKAASRSWIYGDSSSYP